MVMDGSTANMTPKELLANSSVSFEQGATRGDGKVELGEEFSKDSIDFSAVLDHMKIHMEGEVAGSQFNGGMISSPEDVKDLITKNLPDKLNYDQYGVAELTFSVDVPAEEPIGWSGVMPLSQIRERFPEANISKEARMPGGMEAVEDGIEGAWYPEMARDPETGRFEVVMENGQPKNPKGKFEPKANIAAVPIDKFKEVAAVNKFTCIIVKDRNSGNPIVATIFPGDSAPMFPAKIDSADYKSDTLKDPLQNSYWENSAFIKTES